MLMDKYVTSLSQNSSIQGRGGGRKFSALPGPKGFWVNAKWKRLEYGLGREDRTVLPISWVMNKNTMDSPLGQVFPNGTAQLIKSSHHYRVANDAKIVLLSRLTPPFSSHNPRRVSPRLIRDLSLLPLQVENSFATFFYSCSNSADTRDQIRISFSISEFRHFVLNVKPGIM